MELENNNIKVENGLLIHENGLEMWQEEVKKSFRKRKVVEEQMKENRENRKLVGGCELLGPGEESSVIDGTPGIRGIDDSKVATRLLDKNYSPLCVRKYQLKGWPLFVGIICDQSLSDLDKVVYEVAENYNYLLENDIQSIRNFTGVLSDTLIDHYGKIKRGSVEGVAIFYYIDKCAISSLWGDFMVHASCRQEFYFIVNTLPHI